MRNWIGLAAALALLSIPGCSRVYGGSSVSVTFSAGSPDYYYGDYEDIDWDHAMIINDSQIGVWVMLPSGRWVLRCRSMWWDAGYDGWRFGPWWYDYSIAYGTYFVPFHWYMSSYYPRWHDHYFYHYRDHYIRRVDRPFYNHGGQAMRRDEPRGHAKMVEPEQQNYNAPQVVRPHEHSENAPMVRPQEQRGHTTVFTRERSTTVRTDGGDRTQRMNSMSPGPRETEITRENPIQPDRSITRTDSRRELRSR